MSPVIPKGVRRRLRRLSGLPARFIGRHAWLRRRYVRRVLRTIEKYRAKGRTLPENLQRLERQLRRVPKTKRAEMLEQMMEMGTSPDVSSNRALRRAAGRQDRLSGKSVGLRPGLGPGQRRRAPR